MQLFLIQALEDDHFYLTEEEALHCFKVLRKKKGDIIHATDGKGQLLKGVIEDLSRKRCQAKIIAIEKEAKPLNYQLHMAVGLLKNAARYEWFLEKATELGITEITPLISQRTEKKKIKKERWEKILATAMKQSLRLYLPKLNDPISLDDFIKALPERSNQIRLIGHCTELPKEYLAEKQLKNQNIVILIGPEGDFTAGEIGMAFENKFEGIHLGNTRLRTETAAIIACHTVFLQHQ